MPAHVRVGGVWKQATTVRPKQAGVWKTLANGFVKQSGVWKQFYAGVSWAFGGPNLGSLSNLSPSPGTRQVTATFYDDGSVTETGGTLSNWAIPVTAGIGSGMMIRIRIPTGFGYNCSVSRDMWLSFSGFANIQLSNSNTNGEGGGTVYVDFSTDAGFSVLGTVNFIFSVGRVL